MSTDPQEQKQKTPRVRDLRGIGNELASLASDLSLTLRSDWMRATAEEPPDPNVTEKSTGVCIRYGQRLGELSLPTERAEALTDSEVESLRDTSVRDSHSRLARLGSRASFLLSTQLPALMERRGGLAELLTSLSSRWLAVRGDRPFRWHRFLFYLIPAILVLGAEGALAEDITRSAFRLKGHLWMLFPIALLSLPLIFKELLEWELLNRLQRYYVGILLALLFLLLLPLSWTRSSEVFRGAGRTVVSDPFAPAGSQQAGTPRQPGSQGKLVLLTAIFAMFGALFPMVSGLCFYRAWELADKGLESWRVRKEGERTRAEVDAVDHQIGACRTELDTIQHDTIKLVASLGPGDRFVEKMVADLVGSLRGAGPDVVESVRQKIESARGAGGWPELAKRLALEVEALELPGGALAQTRVKFQRDLLSGIAQIDKGDSLESLAEALKKRLRAALSEGHAVGTKAPFAVLAAHSPEEMVQLVRQQKLRDALFRGRRSVRKGPLGVGLALLVLSLPGCSSPPSSSTEDGALRLVVFVEATNDPGLNEDISQTYLKPLYRQLASTEKPFDVTIYPISANTEGETALLRFSHPEPWMTDADAADLADAFGQLRQRYAQVYPAGSSYLVDVLGTAVLLDSALGSSRGERTEVLYLSDMIQQDDVNGYDFTEYARGKSLDQCRAELADRLGPNLRHQDLFRSARIHVVYLGLDALRRGRQGIPESGPITRNMNEIKTFWEKDFFRGFLGARDVLTYPGTIDKALQNIFSPG